MTHELVNAVQNHLNNVIGQRISSAFLVLNSLKLLLDSDADRAAQSYLWFEPTWQIRNNDGVLLGSRQAQVEDKHAHAELDYLVHRINGAVIETIELDSISHDVAIRFSGGYEIRTFVSNPGDDDESWYLRDKHAMLDVGATPQQFFVTPIESTRQ